MKLELGLYQMAISKYFDETLDFYIYGELNKARNRLERMSTIQHFIYF